MAVVWRAEEGARVVGPTIGEGRMGSERSFPMSTNDPSCHSRTSLFSGAVMTALTRGVLLLWAISCSTHSTGRPCVTSAWFLPRLPSSFTVVSPQTNISRALGIWLSFSFQKLFDAQLQLHCSMCQTFWTFRERLNKEQLHGRNVFLNKKLSEQRGAYFPVMLDLMVRLFSI